MIFSLPLALIGVILANLQNVPAMLRTVGILFLVGAVGAQGAGYFLLLAAKRGGEPKGPYSFVPTPSTWRQMGFVDRAFPHWTTINAFVNGDLLDLIGNDNSTGALSTVLRSQLVAIHPRRVQIDASTWWWGIAIQRVDKPEDLEFGIRDDQVDVAAAERRAIAVAAQLTIAMRLGADQA